jgi:hypothetical protein
LRGSGTGGLGGKTDEDTGVAFLKEIHPESLPRTRTELIKWEVPDIGAPGIPR